MDDFDTPPPVPTPRRLTAAGASSARDQARALVPRRGHRGGGRGRARRRRGPAASRRTAPRASTAAAAGRATARARRTRAGWRRRAGCCSTAAGHAGGHDAQLVAARAARGRRGRQAPGARRTRRAARRRDLERAGARPRPSSCAAPPSPMSSRRRRRRRPRARGGARRRRGRRGRRRAAVGARAFARSSRATRFSRAPRRCSTRCARPRRRTRTRPRSSCSSPPPSRRACAARRGRPRARGRGIANPCGDDPAARSRPRRPRPRPRGRQRAGLALARTALSAEAAEGQSRRIGRAAARSRARSGGGRRVARRAAEAKKAAPPANATSAGSTPLHEAARGGSPSTRARRVLDADALALAPLGELFELPAAVNFAAAPDVFPPDKFNAGVLVLTPDAAVRADMLESVPLLQSHDGGDTGFLNSYFDDWWTRAPAARLAFRCVRADLPHRRLASRGRACDAALLPRVSPPPNPPFRPRASDDFYHLFHRLCRRRFARRR